LTKNGTMCANRQDKQNATSRRITGFILRAHQSTSGIRR
jgi:hypothetical protein